MAGGREVSMSLALKAKGEVVKDYFHLFVNRRAYVVQSVRPHQKSGHYYYYRPKVKGTNRPICLTEDTIRRHLEGGVTVGLYAINPTSQRCKWVAIDADYKDAMEDLLKLQFYLTQDNVSLRLGVPVKGVGLPDGIEVFPKQDELRKGDFGNAIRGPLGIHRGAGKRFWFYSANYTLEEQMAYLKSLRKVTAEELGRFIEGKSMPSEATS